MNTITFDVESNGLLDSASVAFSLVNYNHNTNTITSCANVKGLKYKSIEDGLRELKYADKIQGHNICGYDIPLLKLLYNIDLSDKIIVDTLVLSRLLFGSNLKKLDYIEKKIPEGLRGKHSLDAWGHRLGEYKIQYDNFEYWTPEMQEYCEQDVLVSVKLGDYLEQYIKESGYNQRPIDIELGFAAVIARQTAIGVNFDVDKAVTLKDELSSRLTEIESELRTIFPIKVIPENDTVYTSYTSKSNRRISKNNNSIMFIPDYTDPDPSTWISTAKSNRNGYVKGSQFCKVKEVEDSYVGYIRGSQYCNVIIQEFNPGSRNEIADRLIEKYGWEPEERTDKGSVKVDEKILKSLPYKEAEDLARYFKAKKIYGMVYEGKTGWLKLCRDGRIHCTLKTLGTDTGRCSCTHPNLQQVASHSEYGNRCRELFTATEGYKMIGCDAKGLELRLLAHYLDECGDGGAYTETVLNGDIHTYNRIAFGMLGRDGAKTNIYGQIYGAGDPKVGIIMYKDLITAQDKVTAIINEGIDLGELLITNPSKYKYYAEPILNWYKFKDYNFTDMELVDNYRDMIGHVSEDLSIKLKDFDPVKAGRECKERFFTAVPAYKVLMDKMNRVLSKRNWIRLVDGRKVYIRSNHSALNFLIQGSGAVALKLALLIFDRDMQNEGLCPWKDYRLLLNVHDEFDFETRPEYEEVSMNIAPMAITKAGKELGIKCLLEGDVKSGYNWKEIH